MMMLFGRSSQNSQESKIRLERKLYIAKESPDPEFDLSECDLLLVPSGIYSVCKVYRKDYLYLQNNRLQSLAEGGQLSDLHLIKILNLSHNNFLNLPKDIRFLINLTELYLQNNLLNHIPDEIKFLSSLQILDLSKNNLKSLNPAIGELQCLRRLIITDNIALQKLCVELCHATNLLSLEFDRDNFIFPPPEVCMNGTEEVMKFLCAQAKIEYVKPLPLNVDVVQEQGPNIINDPFLKPKISWEQQEEVGKAKENQIQRAYQQQREKFLSHILQDQSNLDVEIVKVQEIRDVARKKLIQAIQKNEQDIECLVKNFIESDRLKPEVIQQQLAHEQLEHNHLLELTRQNYDNIRKNDILKAMEQLLSENHLIDKQVLYKDNLNNIKQHMLIQETEIDGKLALLLKAKDESHDCLVMQLLEDQDIQKTMVASLLDQVDARCWSLNQEILLISSHLARLSTIEQEKKKMNLMYNYNELLYQRTQLLNLLDDLFEQRKKRRKQLIDTMNEAQNESNFKTDFWLRSYQRLLDTAPKPLLDIGKTLDPLLANLLLQEGVIHCLPFLVNFIFSGKSLSTINHESLMKCGVSLKVDRDNIMKALNDYANVEINDNFKKATDTMPQSIPTVIEDKHILSGVVSTQEIDNIAQDAECVICMENKSQVAFVPCGHMCCCQSCAQKNITNCPMCRGDIERTIKVLIA
ncbi:unnamed protein product [Leptidea sinapis]|uniref:RING-type domain-containing protein n=1 Tax=Leptidea sinapis TaxID=189913 RepID=A0A5E4Q2P2_9NEOP|nr:unnamed protein product [Leptidea sinapis]